MGLDDRVSKNYFQFLVGPFINLFFKCWLTVDGSRGWEAVGSSSARQGGKSPQKDQTGIAEALSDLQQKPYGQDY